MRDRGKPEYKGVERGYDHVRGTKEAEATKHDGPILFSGDPLSSVSRENLYLDRIAESIPTLPSTTHGTHILYKSKTCKVCRLSLSQRLGSEDFHRHDLSLIIGSRLFKMTLVCVTLSARLPTL